MDVKITRRIPASVETVYRAWTDPAQIAEMARRPPHRRDRG